MKRIKMRRIKNSAYHMPYNYTWSRVHKAVDYDNVFNSVWTGVWGDDVGQTNHNVKRMIRQSVREDLR